MNVTSVKSNCVWMLGNRCGCRERIKGPETHPREIVHRRGKVECTKVNATAGCLRSKQLRRDQSSIRSEEGGGGVRLREERKEEEKDEEEEEEGEGETREAVTATLRPCTRLKKETMRGNRARSGVRVNGVYREWTLFPQPPFEGRRLCETAKWTLRHRCEPSFKSTDKNNHENGENGESEGCSLVSETLSEYSHPTDSRSRNGPLPLTSRSRVDTTPRSPPGRFSKHVTALAVCACPLEISGVGSISEIRPSRFNDVSAHTDGRKFVVWVRVLSAWGPFFLVGDTRCQLGEATATASTATADDDVDDKRKRRSGPRAGQRDKAERDKKKGQRPMK
ncbi:hypothetical protein V1478_008299 [Vespula squamosa]|uniref:Uncharacterized protein n=1 Tax=Vespula squamosa TaxID=30214 RepID=A0ABD2AYE7_VESSQ